MCRVRQTRVTNNPTAPRNLHCINGCFETHYTTRVVANTNTNKHSKDTYSTKCDGYNAAYISYLICSIISLKYCSVIFGSFHLCLKNTSFWF